MYVYAPTLNLMVSLVTSQASIANSVVNKSVIENMCAKHALRNVSKAFSKQGKRTLRCSHNESLNTLSANLQFQVNSINLAQQILFLSQRKKFSSEKLMKYTGTERDPL